MRKLLISLFAVAALGTGAAFAQSGFWAGVSGGYPGAEAHFGVENVFAGLDLRANVGYSYSVGALTVGAGVLYHVKRVYDVAQRLAHLFAGNVPYKPVYEYLSERLFAH